MRKIVDLLLVMPLLVAIGYLLYAAGVNGTLFGNPTPTRQAAFTATVSPTRTLPATSTPTMTATATATPLPTQTPSRTPTETATLTSLPTDTPTARSTPTVTETVALTQVEVPAATPTR